MKTFKDTTGRTWQVEINVSSLKRLRDVLQVNLLELADNRGELLTRLMDDPVLLCDVLYVLCRPQADSAGVTDEAFGRAMGGDVLDQATDALLTELVDFFPKGRRQILARILEKTQNLVAKGLDLAAAKLADPMLDHQIEAMLRERIDSALSAGGGSAGNSPDSSASIPAPTP